MDLEATFETDTPLIGMVHLPPLPGAPRYDGDRKKLRGEALTDSLALIEAGFDGLLVENYGDEPYHADDVPKHVVAELAATVRELGIAINHPFGVNVLRNDAEAALAVAAATGGSFVRVNVHTGVRATDQGQLEGTAAQTLRLRDRLGEDVAVLADVAVKHSTDAAERPVSVVARETIDRGLADGLIVSGPETARPPTDERIDAVLEGVRTATRDVPVLLGSGLTAENAPDLLKRVDGGIVGTALKYDGQTANRIDPDRANEFVAAVRDG